MIYSPFDFCSLERDVIELQVFVEKGFMEVFLYFASTAWNILNRSANASLFTGVIITLRKAFSRGYQEVLKKLNKEQKGVKIRGPMDNFSNQLTPQLSSLMKAKFAAYNLVATEVGNYQIRTNC